jgi:hypothetical protein
MTKPDMKPCPFCGETEFLVAYNSPLKVAKGGGRVLKDQYQVRCKNNAVHAMVTMEVSSSDTADQAIAAWNTRAVDPATIREAALREAAENCKTCQCRDEILALIGEKT